MDVEYSNINNIIGENSKNLVNDSRTFNQWTGKHTDSCEYKQLLNLSTKPMQYYVNSLNNISGTNDPYLSFTPIGNAKGEYISKINLSSPLPFITIIPFVNYFVFLIKPLSSLLLLKTMFKL